jgi:hypothetical protein
MILNLCEDTNGLIHYRLLVAWSGSGIGPNFEKRFAVWSIIGRSSHYRSSVEHYI